MEEPIADRVLGSQFDCTFTSDPRVNKELGARLHGQNVVIAGAGRGVGRATAEFFAYTEAATLSLMALEQAEVDETAALCRQISPKLTVKTAAFNVLEYSAVQSFIDKVIEEFGQIDVLFMNAGRGPQWLATHESDPDIWWDAMAVSLRGAFNFTRAALPYMRKQSDGARIVYTSSSGAHADQGMGGYVIGKLGQVRLAEIVHNENRDKNIKAFAYHPGAIQTRFFYDYEDALQGNIKDGSYLSKDLLGDQKSARTAVEALSAATFSTPQTPAGLVTVLASGQLDFMSGRYLDATVKIEDYLADEKRIVLDDLHRVRLVVDKDKGIFLPHKRDL